MSRRFVYYNSGRSFDNLFQNAVAYYKFDENSGDAIDVVNGYNGKLFGGITQGVNGKIGNAYNFDGSSGFIDIESEDDFNFTDGVNDVAFTIRCWVKLNSANVQMLFGKAESGALEYYFRIIGGKISLQLFSLNNTASHKRRDTIANVNTGSWTQIVVTYDGFSDIKIYQNGVEESTNNASNGVYSNMAKTNTSVQISRNKFVNSQFINGKLDELVVIKGEAWSDVQVLEDYNNGNGTTI